MEKNSNYNKIIPPRFENTNYEKIDSRIKTCFEQIKESRKGMYIYGSVGTGKTHIAYAVYKKCQELSLKCRFFNSVDILDKIRDDYKHEDSYNLKSILEYKGLLIIDDIGTEKLTEWVLETFYRIINQRYEDMLPIVFTSNFSLDDLSDRLGERIPSRIAGSCDVIELSGKDKRLN